MRIARVLLLTKMLVGAAFVLSLATLAEGQSERISFQSLTFPGDLWTPFMPLPSEGSPSTVSGVLRLPPGTARLPAVILTHGCAGIRGAELAWATTLDAFGIATFVVDSFAGRSIPEVCTGHHRLNIASVLTDVYRAMSLMAAHPRIDAGRIAIMGLSFGGRTALWASHHRSSRSGMAMASSGLRPTLPSTRPVATSGWRTKIESAQRRSGSFMGRRTIGSRSARASRTLNGCSARAKMRLSWSTRTLITPSTTRSHRGANSRTR